MLGIPLSHSQLEYISELASTLSGPESSSVQNSILKDHEFVLPDKRKSICTRSSHWWFENSRYVFITYYPPASTILLSSDQRRFKKGLWDFPFPGRPGIEIKTVLLPETTQLR